MRKSEEKRALVVVDYQNDFVTGSLGFARAAALEDAIADKIARAKRQGTRVIFTMDTHPQPYRETEEGRHLPVPHCLENTEGWQLYGRVAALCDENTPMFHKETFGCLALANYLHDERFTGIELVGVVTNMCVISNAVLAKAACPQAVIRVDADCVACPVEADNRRALKMMEQMHIEILHGGKEEERDETGKPTAHDRAAVPDADKSGAGGGREFFRQL